MATSITTIQSSDLISDSRTDINNNFDSLNTNKIETDYLDTDTTLAANSDSKIATQKAVKAYADSVASPVGKSWNEYAVDAVGTDAYAITLTGYTAYTVGDVFKFKAGTANTGACSLKVNGLSVIAIKKNVSDDLATGDILANQIVTVIYDGTNMQLQSFPTLTTLLSAYQPIMLFKCGSTTYDLSTASGTQNIAHGLGAIPKYVKLTAVFSQATGASITQTVYNGTTQASVYMAKTDNEEYHGALFLVSKEGAVSGYQTGVVTFDGTNIIITWTKTGSLTGTANIMWEAQY